MVGSFPGSWDFKSPYSLGPSLVLVFGSENRESLKLKSQRIDSNITADMNFSNYESLINLVIFVWTLGYLTNLTFTTKDVYFGMFKKILPAVFLLKLKTRLCSGLCTRLTGSDPDLSNYNFKNSWLYSFCCRDWNNIQTDIRGGK